VQLNLSVEPFIGALAMEDLDIIREAEERVKYLRARGVEFELPEERRAPQTTSGAADTPLLGPLFSFVHIPADDHQAVCERRAGKGERDVLPALLGPSFADDGRMDEDVVARETASRMHNMLQAGGSTDLLKAPTAQTMQQLSASGVCESYPLAGANEENGWRAVRLYIDEVGALRGRPRNARAEALALAAGLAGLRIHGDAYVGRSERVGGGEANASFALDELAPDSAWATAARGQHLRAAAQDAHTAEEHLPSGDQGLFSWSQTEDDVEVRVRGAPSGRGAAKRVAVQYGSGSTLCVLVDGATVLEIRPLFARVTPDDCNWIIDQGCVVITLEKAEARPWATLGAHRAVLE